MPYSANTQALSTSTSKKINGSAPYLTIDNGVTKLTTTNDLLAIELSDGTRITPESNVSDDTPIVLPKEGQTLADIKMLVPVAADSITIDELVGPPNNYWGDDDGDTVISATGKLSANITDSQGNKISRSVTLDVCNSPYRITLTNTDSKLNTKYGFPKSLDYAKSSTTYYINPKGKPIICYVRPDTRYGDKNFAGPLNVWTPSKGFVVQSTEPSTYSQNFPTTGANNLYFDILAGGIDGLRLRWPSVTKGGITATMTLKPSWSWEFNPDRSSSVRVTFTGPAATPEQQRESSANNPVPTPTLPQTFEIVAYDSNNKAVLKYGFVLKQWFVNRRKVYQRYSNTLKWCKNLGSGYRLSKIKDLTNVSGGSWEAAMPASSGSDYYQRNIGAGLFTEWGTMRWYSDAGFDTDSGYWTTDGGDDKKYVVYPYRGDVQRYYIYNSSTGLCTYP